MQKNQFLLLKKLKNTGSAQLCSLLGPFQDPELKRKRSLDGRVNYGYVMEANGLNDTVSWVRVPLDTK